MSPVKIWKLPFDNNRLSEEAVLLTVKCTHEYSKLWKAQPLWTNGSCQKPIFQILTGDIFLITLYKTCSNIMFFLDCYLLGEALHEFREQCFRNYRIYPDSYLSLPGFSLGFARSTIIKYININMIITWLWLKHKHLYILCVWQMLVSNSLGPLSNWYMTKTPMNTLDRPNVGECQVSRKDLNVLKR